ncbi:Exodeoxyribonuclease 7 small subunit [bioreactor metagenome]|uniref:Exodeoxyribonuclease 7 small subunit n=1 Tax=bioreactor metagenome TaxID=1076179 RepID=A0A644ZGU6_9ZZZZ|nr:exodeoxyribonuclease VII small subunit [Christensenella sp.]
MEQKTSARKAAQPKPEPEPAPRFEESMQKLSEIVGKLESGEGSLDEMIHLYENGMTLVNDCERQLDAYEATIARLNGAAEE